MPSFSIDQAMAGRARRGLAAVEGPGGVGAIEHLDLRLARAEEARHVAVPGRQRVEHRHRQREPTGNLGAGVADLEDDAALGLQRPRPVERAGAGLAVGLHGQAAGERARDGVAARGQLLGVDRSVVVRCRSRAASGRARDRPSRGRRRAPCRRGGTRRWRRRPHGRAPRARARTRRGRARPPGGPRRRGALCPPLRLVIASRHSQCGGDCATGALAPAPPPTRTARRSASPGRPRPRRSPSSVIGGGAPSRRL